MCDCYNQKCHYCDNEVSIHIADFCVKRESIVLLCPDCQDAPSSNGFDLDRLALLFVDTIDNREQIVGKLRDKKYVGKTVLIFCKDPKAYGIRLN
jgi:hypothetical protein